MGTGRLSFMETVLRRPRLAHGVWVPVVPQAGLPGRLWMESRQFSFLQPPGPLRDVLPPTRGQLMSPWGSGCGR